MRKQSIIILVIITVWAAWLDAGITCAEPLDVHISPNLVRIGAFYNGGHVTVTGQVPDEAEVVVQLNGATHEVELLKKGKVFQLLWMNTDTVVFHGTPSVYMLFLPEAVPASQLDENKSLQMGYKALKKNCTIEPVHEDKDRQFAEFIRLKKKEGIYIISEKAVTYQDQPGPNKTFTCEVYLPSSMAQGNYTLQSMVLKNGSVVQIEKQTLSIKEVGLPAMISSLAFDHGAMYGIIATLIALAAGFLTGLVFKDEGGAH